MKKLAFGLCGCLLIALAGCAGMESRKSDSSTTLEAQALGRFTDLPTPAGFKFVAQDSYSFEAGTVRVGVLKYKGKAAPEQVITFYKEQMPMYNWNLLNVVEYGDRLLNFDRENETCVISLQASGESVRSITVSLGPKSQVNTRKRKEPLK